MRLMVYTLAAVYMVHARLNLPGYLILGCTSAMMVIRIALVWAASYADTSCTVLALLQSSTARPRFHLAAGAMQVHADTAVTSSVRF